MLTAELVINFAQQKFIRISKYALDYFDEEGLESDYFIRDMLRLDAIIRALSNDNLSYTYQDLECLYQAVQAICDPDMPLEFTPFDWPPFVENPNNPENPSSSGEYSLYRGPWFPGAKVRPKTLWLYNGQLFASKREDEFTATEPPHMDGDANWLRTGALVADEVKLVHLSDEVRTYIESQAGSGGGGTGGGDSVQPAEIVPSTGTNTFETTNIPQRLLGVWLYNKNKSKFITNPYLKLDTDYTHEAGTRVIQITRDGYIADTEDYLVVLYRRNTDQDVAALTTPEWSYLPEGDVVDWDFEHKYVSNKVLPNRLNTDVYIVAKNPRNGGHYSLEVHQSTNGNKDVWFSYNGTSLPLPIAKEPNALTVLEGWRNNTGKIFWYQKLTAILI